MTRKKLTLNGQSIAFPKSAVPGLTLRTDSKNWRWEFRVRTMRDGVSTRQTPAVFLVDPRAKSGTAQHLDMARQAAERFALNWLAQHQGKVGRASVYDADLTLGAWLERYLDELARSQTPEGHPDRPVHPILNKAWDREASLIRTLLGQATQGRNTQGLPGLTQLRIAELTADLAVAQLKTLQGRHGPATPDTIQKYLTQLSLVYNRAKAEWGYGVNNPFGDMKGLRDHHHLVLSKGREIVITPAQFQVIRTQIQLSHLTTKAAIAFCLATACRRGEAVKLNWENLDRAAGITTATFLDTKAKVGQPKSRTVPVLGRGLVALRAMALLQRYETVLGVVVRERQGRHQAIPARPLPRPSASQWQAIARLPLTGPVFRLEGQRLRADTITQAWTRARNRAKLPTLRLHDLRHTAITRFVDEGKLSALATALVAGHSNMQTTLRYYQGNPKVIGQTLKANLGKGKGQTSTLVAQIKALPQADRLALLAAAMGK